MFARKVTILLAGAALLALPLAAVAQGKGKAGAGGSTTTTVPVGGSQGPVTAESLITRYTSLAGSTENATSLVNGLRSGTPVTLTAEVAAPPPPPPPAPPPPPPPGGLGGLSLLPPPPPPPSTQSLTPATTIITVEFTPPTGNLGFGNVDIALAFTEAQLTELGLQKPDPNQLKAALVGGEVEYGTSNPKQKKTLPGILQLRASGMGWGQIAAQLGYKLQ